MEKSNIDILVIDDTPNLEDDEFIYELRQKYKKVIIHSSSSEGLEYFIANSDKKTIIILDYQFSGNELDGISTLEKIKEISEIVPVILWTAHDDIGSDNFKILINNHAFGFFERGEDYGALLKAIDEAELFLKTSVESALEEWITIQDEAELDKPYLITAYGKAYTLNEILQEVRTKTPFGEKISQDLLMLTIDLLTRNKREIHD